MAALQQRMHGTGPIETTAEAEATFEPPPSAPASDISSVEESPGWSSPDSLDLDEIQALVEAPASLEA